ncbi:hypothetical protein ACP70R_009238 [Stipagrostis hirtigluma subsp. patula]
MSKATTYVKLTSVGPQSSLQICSCTCQSSPRTPFFSGRNLRGSSTPFAASCRVSLFRKWRLSVWRRRDGLDHWWSFLYVFAGPSYTEKFIMPKKEIYMSSVEQAIEIIIPYLEDTGNTAYKAIYFDGWEGLAASTVLRAIAEHPPPSLTKRFDKIIHIDCSRWKSRRALQRAIAEELNLPPWVMAAFDRQDEEDDFSGVDQGSRAEIVHVAKQIYQILRDFSCLVILHNGSDSTVDLENLGIPRYDWLSSNRHVVLWTFRGRLRFNPELKNKVDKSHLYLYRRYSVAPYNAYVLEEAQDVVRYTKHKQSITPEVAAKCFVYLLWLNNNGGGIMDYNWPINASNYWVCDGIIQGGQFDEAWEISAALHQEIRIEDCSSASVQLSCDYSWKSVTYTSEGGEKKEIKIDTIVSPELTSFFLAAESGLYAPLRSDMFQKSEKLSVLKLSGCTFSFYSPPFHCCRSLRFLGLDHCKDQRQQEERGKQRRLSMDFFKSLWVLDISYTDWELELSPHIIEQMATNLRDVHIKKGRMWCNNLAWRQLGNLRKLRVVEPTSSWETGKEDEFIDMVKLELLDLSGNNTIQVLPSLSKATCLKTLVLDGCVGLKHVGPDGLPPSLESFCFDARGEEEHSKKAIISRIALAGCARLTSFTLCGKLPDLEELDLSCTAIKMLDLAKVVTVQKLQRVLLMGCGQLRSITWPANGMQGLRLLCIDTRGGEAVCKTSFDYSLVPQEREELCHAYIAVSDMRFLQSLFLTSGERFCWSSAPFKLNLCLSSFATSKDDGENCDKEMVGPYSPAAQLVWSPRCKTLTSKACRTYNDVGIEQITTSIYDMSEAQLQPLDCHVEICRGISMTDVLSDQATKAIIYVMNRVQSLHVHDNSSVTTVIPEHMMSRGEMGIQWQFLKRCRIERCPKLEIVFITNYDEYCFHELETFWAADLLMARSVWSKGRIVQAHDSRSFAKLRDIHLYFCPRLTFVLPLSWFYTLSSLETLHIVSCGDLRQVFPVEAEFLEEIATEHQNGMLKFPKLKDLYLHHLSSLQQICEAKMFAPMLETVRLRGCWGLRRLPATDSRRLRDGRLVVVDCEKDWWDKLEWDGMDVGHHRDLFAPRHSAYYKKRLLKGKVLV